VVLVHRWHSGFLITLGHCHHLEGLEIWWIIEHLVELFDGFDRDDCDGC
jgi:hypothetical protein